MMNEKELIMPTHDEDEIEIDLMDILLALKKRLIWILLAAVLGGGISGVYSYYMLTPQYTSTAMVYILSKETTLTSLADLQIGSQLTQDYRVIVTSRPVLEDVIERLGLNMSYVTLRGKLTIGNPSNTRILSISASDSNPEMAKKIVDTVAETSSDYIGDIMEMVPPKLIESGMVPTEKSGPNNKKNVMLGALVGAMLVCFIVVLEVLFNDTVKDDEDVAHYLGLTVLASVPEREGETPEDKEAMARNVHGRGLRENGSHGRSRKKKRRDRG